MGGTRPGGVVAIMGSGETSPTMVSIHRELAGRLPADRAHAVLLQTPYGFQENADEISARARTYFRRSVGLEVEVVPDAAGDAVRAADWVFSGPGSPTYALEVWRSGPMRAALRDRVRAAHGATVFASAAAATMGIVAVPVYEIYKVGARPFWLDGLDVLAGLGLRVAVIPHYDNREGGSHDTRYCYLGERRLREIEKQLPAGAAVVGVDEHTAAILDPGAGTVEVKGRGALTVRRDGRSVVFPAGSTLALDEFRALTREPISPSVTSSALARPAEVPTLSQVVADCEQRFAAADTGDGMVGAVLDLESAIAEWSGDTEEDDGPGQARAALRALIVRLGRFATAAAGDGERLRRALPGLVAVRDALRGRREFAMADGIREALALAGVHLRDTGTGTEW